MPPRPVYDQNPDGRADCADRDHSPPHGRHPPSGQKQSSHEHHSGGGRRRNGGARTRFDSPRRIATGVFTFGHASRQVRLGPVAFWTVVGTLVIMAGWSVVTATYFATEAFFQLEPPVRGEDLAEDGNEDKLAPKLDAIREKREPDGESSDQSEPAVAATQRDVTKSSVE